jgi:biotin carboxyl carrier protein
VRDVIRVERRLDAPEPSNGSPSPDRPTVSSDDGASTSVDRRSLEALDRIADEILPPLVARLAVSRLGEVEVRHGAWHVRVRRAPLAPTADPPVPAGGAPGGLAEQAGSTDGTAHPHTRPSLAHDPAMATSPAVGYFAPGPGLAVGTRFVQGDLIGWVDVLGVRQDVVAPVDGLVGKLLAGPGDPVEYGQELVQLVASGASGSAKDGTDEEGAG